MCREHTLCMLLAQLLVANGELPISICDRELSDHVTAVTANNGSHMIRNPASPPGNRNLLKTGGSCVVGMVIVLPDGKATSPSVPWVYSAAEIPFPEGNLTLLVVLRGSFCWSSHRSCVP